MVCDHLTKKLVFTIMCSFVGLCGLPGCTHPDYKKDADEKVYNIIDKKWKNEFGTKANYKISDTVPSPNDIQIEKVIPASGILTLPQAVAIATAHNRDYQTQKEELYMKALYLRLSHHEFEPLLFGTGGATYAKNDLGEDEVAGVAGGPGLTWLLKSGTKLTSNIALTWARELTGGWGRPIGAGLVTSVLTAELTQPLLRGSDQRVVLENLTQAERDTLYQLRLFSRFRKTFVVSVISQYYGILQAYDAVKNARRNYNTLDWLYERVEKLANAGRLPKFELDGVAQNRLIALDRYIEAEKEYKLLLDQFKVTLGLPTIAELRLDPNELEGLRTAELVEPDFNEEVAVETALSGRLDLLNSADAVTDAQRKVFVAADALGGDLSVRIKASVPSRDLTQDVKDLDWQDKLTVGLEGGPYSDRVPEQVIYRKALITLNQRQREYEQASDTVALEVRSAYRDWREAARRYKVQSGQLRLAQKRLKDTFLLMQYGRANSRRVLDAQKDLFDAQNAATKAMVAYTSATLNLYRDTEVLGVRPDGMWEKRGMTDEGQWTMGDGR
jgi:outer membrane protein TolC